VDVPDLIRERIAAWHTQHGMPDVLLVDIYQHLLGERLSTSPTSCLRRTRRGHFEGMVYEFTVTLPGPPPSRHRFVFHLVYGRDENTLIVVGGGYFPEFLI